MERRFSGTFGKEQVVPGAAETPLYWVIPGGDSAPTKCSSRCQASGKGRNIFGIVERNFVPAQWAESLALRGGVSGPTTFPHGCQLSDMERNFPGMFARSFFAL